MNEQQKFEKRKQRTKIILITISVLFMIVMLVLPLFSVITNSLSEGFKFYVSSISTEYVRSDPSDQHLLWNEYPDRICDSRSHFSNHFRDLPICVKGDHTDLKLTGKRRRRGSSIDGSQWIYDLSKDHTSSDEMGIDLWDHLM